jgi:hypothetical protein
MHAAGSKPWVQPSLPLDWSWSIIVCQQKHQALQLRSGPRSSRLLHRAGMMVKPLIYCVCFEGWKCMELFLLLTKLKIWTLLDHDGYCMNRSILFGTLFSYLFRRKVMPNQINFCIWYYPIITNSSFLMKTKSLYDY